MDFLPASQTMPGIGLAKDTRPRLLSEPGSALDMGLALANGDVEMNPQVARRVMKDVIGYWNANVNPGFLQYRKSVTVGQDFAAIEWADGTDGATRGTGNSTVVDAMGRKYIDCLGGFGCYNAGRSHPRIVGAVKAQMGRIPLHSQELLDPLRAYLAAALAGTMPEPNSGREEDRLKYAFFGNSGTEAVEACLKMAALTTGRRSFFALRGAFHGKTLGSLGCTSKAAFRGPLLNLIPRVTHLPVNDVGALEAAFECAAFAGELPAGVIIEPVLGEGGVFVVSAPYLRAARRLCDKHGSCLIFDEVQSGMGRCGSACGRLWACEASGVAPDLMACGKALGGGVAAIGACVGSARTFSKLFENPFLHTTTFGGMPAACAGALAALAVARDENLPGQASAKGEWLLGRLQDLAAAHPRVLKEARGRGLLLGLEFVDDAVGYAFASRVFAAGVLVSGTLVNAKVIRVEPPLVIAHEQLQAVVRVFADVIAGLDAELQAQQLAAAAGDVPKMAAGAGSSESGASPATVTCSWVSSPPALAAAPAPAPTLAAAAVAHRSSSPEYDSEHEAPTNRAASPHNVDAEAADEAGAESDGATTEGTDSNPDSPVPPHVQAAREARAGFGSRDAAGGGAGGGAGGYAGW